MVKPKTALLIFLIFISVAINLYFRLNTYFLRSCEDVAKEEVFADIKRDLLAKLSLTYPSLNENSKEALLPALFAETLRQDKKAIDKTIHKKSQELRDFYQDGRGWTYLLETDSYRWLRRVENYLNKGIFGTRLIGKKQYDDLRMAPNGELIEPMKLHFYIGVYLYKLLHFINNKLSVMNCLALHPVILSPFIVIGIFCFSILFGISYRGSFVASIIVGLSPIVLFRSSFGWFDTDVYNMFIPLFIAACLGYALKGEGIHYKIFFILSGLLVGVYSALWRIWWIPFYIFLCGLCLYILDFIIYDTRKIFSKKALSSFLYLFLFIASSYLFVVAISGFGAIKNSISEPLFYLHLRNDLSLDNFWPNLFFSVSELKPADIDFFVSGTGGDIVLYCSIIGMLLFIVDKRSTLPKEKKALFFMLFFWFIISFILTWLSRRSIIFFVVPLGIFGGVFFDKVYELLLTGYNKSALLQNINKKMYTIFLNCLVYSVCLIPILNASKIVQVRNMNDIWFNMTQKIKELTPPDAIIGAWWDQGDYIMTLGGRATLQDAEYMCTPVSYWFSKALLSENETESFGIMRMLASGSFQSFDELLKALHTDNKLATFELIKELILLPEKEGRNRLSGLLADKTVTDKISGLIYGPHRPVYILVYNEMVKFMHILSRVSNWDFRRMLLWEKFPVVDKQAFVNYANSQLKYSKKETEEIYRSLKVMNKNDALDWVSKDKYIFYTDYSELKAAKDSGSLLFFDNGITIDKDSLKAFFCDSASGKTKAAGQVIFVSQDAVKKNTNLSGDKNYSVLLYTNGDIYKATLFSSPLAESLFFRLFFMDGRDLKHFKLVHHESKEGKGNIYLYKVE